MNKHISLKVRSRGMVLTAVVAFVLLASVGTYAAFTAGSPPLEQQSAAERIPQLRAEIAGHKRALENLEDLGPELQEEIDELQAEVDRFEKRLAEAEQKRDLVKSEAVYLERELHELAIELQAAEAIRNAVLAKAENAEQATTANAEAAERHLAEITALHETAKEQKTKNETLLSELDQKIDTANGKLDDLEGLVAIAQSGLDSARERESSAKARYNKLLKEKGVVEKELKKLEMRETKLVSEVRKLEDKAGVDHESPVKPTCGLPRPEDIFKRLPKPPLPKLPTPGKGGFPKLSF